MTKRVAPYPFPEHRREAVAGAMAFWFRSPHRIEGTCRAAAMGFNRTWKFIEDARRSDANLVCVCPRCGHRVVFERETLISILSALNVNPLVEIAASKLRCSACRHRGCILEMTGRPDAEAIELRAGDSLPPRGLRVSISQWCKMNEHERRRLRRMARS